MTTEWSTMPYHRRTYTPPYCTSYDPDHLVRTSKLEWVDEADPYARPASLAERVLTVIIGLSISVIIAGTMLTLV